MFSYILILLLLTLAFVVSYLWIPKTMWGDYKKALKDPSYYGVKLAVLVILFAINPRNIIGVLAYVLVDPWLFLLFEYKQPRKK